VSRWFATNAAPLDLQWYRREAGEIMSTVYLDIQYKFWSERRQAAKNGLLLACGKLLQRRHGD
jgi:hypothetical protein